MSTTRRLFDGVKSGLASLLDRVAGEDDGPVREVSAAELEVELDRRAAARGPVSVDSPLAARASSAAPARTAREKMAREREARVRAARDRRAEAEQQARDAALRDVKRKAAQEAARAATSGAAGAAGAGGASRPGAGGSARAGGPRGGGPRPGSARDAAVAKYYKALDLPFGASFDQVKASFRRLMRKYHPDMHGGNAQKQRAATELTKQFTEAYNELEKYLLGGPNKDG
jgi:hypothetical protein